MTELDRITPRTCTTCAHVVHHHSYNHQTVCLSNKLSNWNVHLQVASGNFRAKPHNQDETDGLTHSLARVCVKLASYSISKDWTQWFDQ